MHTRQAAIAFMQTREAALVADLTREKGARHSAEASLAISQSQLAEQVRFWGQRQLS